MKITECQRKELVRFAHKQFHIISKWMYPNTHKYLKFNTCNLKEKESYILGSNTLMSKISLDIKSIIKCFNKYNLTQLKSRIIFTIIHELSHVQQAMDGYRYCTDKKYRRYIEDSNEINTILVYTKYTKYIKNLCTLSIPKYDKEKLKYINFNKNRYTQSLFFVKVLIGLCDKLKYNQPNLVKIMNNNKDIYVYVKGYEYAFELKKNNKFDDNYNFWLEFINSNKKYKLETNGSHKTEGYYIFILKEI